MSGPSVLKSSLTLALIAAVCTALVAVTYAVTQERIAANEKAFVESSLRPALSGVVFDSDISGSRVILESPHGLPGREDAVIYRVFSGDVPAAALFAVTAEDGYSGPIRVLVGIDVQGVISGVRILRHRETPGLGDEIESRKSDWVLQFAGRSLEDPALDGWQIRRDGGQFDQLTGASVTPRAVIGAIRETLIYFNANQQQVFAMQETAE